MYGSNSSTSDDLFHESMIVLQPATFCNLDCEYCYLDTRDQKDTMSVEVAEKVAEYVKSNNQKYDIAFHGGEPLTTGIDKLEALAAIFKTVTLRDKVDLCIQTNATLINEKWCSLFRKYDFKVGVSLDGPESMTKRRKYRNGRESFSTILRGINYLKENDISFGIIAVVGEENLGRAEELYFFTREIGAQSLAINVEEIDGINTSGLCPSERVKDFWRDLYLAWQKDKEMSVREFDKAFEMLSYVSNAQEEGLDLNQLRINILPSVSAKGDVSLLSPELMNGSLVERHNFVVGNVLEKPLDQLILIGKNVDYVACFVKGVKRCSEVCDYFSVCRGGYASNKFFENGTTNSTETNHCRTSTMLLYDALLPLL